MDFPMIDPCRDIRYHCTRCGDCCRNVGQSIPLQSIEIYRIAKFLRDTGLPNGSIQDVILNLTDMVLLTELGYPVFFAKTVGDENRCIFLSGTDCTIEKAKPRACRQYPFSALPADDGKRFDYFLVSKKHHHFDTKTKVNTGEWMENNFSSEDRAFSLCDGAAASELGRRLKTLSGRDAAQNDVLIPFISAMYFDYSLDEPFMLQYAENIHRLKSILDDMIRHL